VCLADEKVVGYTFWLIFLFFLELDHMVSFILKEAQEKAAETLVKAREQFAR
jgi:hypothetical protein